MMIDEFKKFNNINFYIERRKPYLKIGRYQTEKEAHAIDTEVLDMLHTYNIPYIKVEGLEGVSKIMLQHILNINNGK